MAFGQTHRFHSQRRCTSSRKKSTSDWIIVSISSKEEEHVKETFFFRMAPVGPEHYIGVWITQPLHTMKDAKGLQDCCRQRVDHATMLSSKSNARCEALLLIVRRCSLRYLI
jgi:hypothetical protein